MLRTVWKSGLLFLSRNALDWLFKILQGLQGKPTTYRLTWHSGTGNWFHYVKKNHAQLGVVFPCLSPQPSHSLGQDVISKPWVIVKGLMWFYLSMKLFVAFPSTHSSYMPRSCSHSGKLRRRKSRQTGLLSEHVLSWSLEMGEDRSLENWGYVHNYTYIIMSYPLYTQCNSNLYIIYIYICFIIVYFLYCIILHYIIYILYSNIIISLQYIILYCIILLYLYFIYMYYNTYLYNIYIYIYMIYLQYILHPRI